MKIEKINISCVFEKIRLVLETMKEIDSLNNFLKNHFNIPVGQCVDFSHPFSCHLSNGTKVHVTSVGKDNEDNHTAAYVQEMYSGFYIISANNLFMKPLSKAEVLLYVK